VSKGMNMHTVNPTRKGFRAKVNRNMMNTVDQEGDRCGVLIESNRSPASATIAGCSSGTEPTKFRAVGCREPRQQFARF
jgi:hypothetical protein